MMYRAAKRQRDCRFLLDEEVHPSLPWLRPTYFGASEAQRSLPRSGAEYTAAAQDRLWFVKASAPRP